MTNHLRTMRIRSPPCYKNIGMNTKIFFSIYLCKVNERPQLNFQSIPVLLRDTYDFIYRVQLLVVISALGQLLQICDSYAQEYGLKNNGKKGEFLVFKVCLKTYSKVPVVSLCGKPLCRVTRFLNIQATGSLSTLKIRVILRGNIGRRLSVETNLRDSHNLQKLYKLKFSKFTAYHFILAACGLHVQATCLKCPVGQVYAVGLQRSMSLVK